MELHTKYCDTCEATVRLSEDGYCMRCGKHADNMKTDQFGRPLFDTCRTCKNSYPLDYSDEDKYGDELRPVRGYCPKCHNTSNNHYYPFI